MNQTSIKSTNVNIDEKAILDSKFENVKVEKPFLGSKIKKCAADRKAELEPIEKTVNKEISAYTNLKQNVSKIFEKKENVKIEKVLPDSKIFKKREEPKFKSFYTKKCAADRKAEFEPFEKFVNELYDNEKRAVNKELSGYATEPKGYKKNAEMFLNFALEYNVFELKKIYEYKFERIHRLLCQPPSTWDKKSNSNWNSKEKWLDELTRSMMRASHIMHYIKKQIDRQAACEELEKIARELYNKERKINLSSSKKLPEGYDAEGYEEYAQTFRNFLCREMGNADGDDDVEYHYEGQRLFLDIADLLEQPPSTWDKTWSGNLMTALNDLLKAYETDQGMKMLLTCVWVQDHLAKYSGRKEFNGKVTHTNTYEHNNLKYAGKWVPEDHE